jgi:hypothetical protein
MALKEVVRNEFVRQLVKFVQKMEASKGDFTLAMLVPSPSGLIDKWNLVVSAKWIDDQELLRAIPTISSALLKYLSQENAGKIERISPLSTSDSIVRDLVGSVEVTPLAGRGVRVQSFALTSRGIEDAIILAARNPSFVQSRQPQTVRVRG